jgi:hypothetical protein
MSQLKSYKLNLLLQHGLKYTKKILHFAKYFQAMFLEVKVLKMERLMHESLNVLDFSIVKEIQN